MAASPYRPVMESRVRDTIGHVGQVDVYPRGGAAFQLDATDLVIEFDEAWAPRGRAVFACPIPDDPAQAAALDGRLASRVKVSLGYVDESETRDVHLAADMVLSASDTSLPDNQLRVDAFTDEVLAQEDIYRDTDGTPPGTGVVEFLAWIIQKAVAPHAAVVTAVGIVPAWRPWLTTDAAQVGMTWWEIIEEVALRAGLYVYAGGAREWTIILRSRISSTSSAVLRTGGRGTITAISQSINRSDWHNSVFVRYRWRDQFGSDQELVANKSVISGPYAISAVGRKTYVRDMTMAATRDQADAAALELLHTVRNRGGSYVVTAVAQYWLRPGMTVTIRLTTGAIVTEVLASVVFRPLDGLMTITTKTAAEIASTE